MAIKYINQPYYTSSLYKKVSNRNVGYYIKRVTTDNAASQRFQKCEDSTNEIERIIDEAKMELNSNKSNGIIISVVWANSKYRKQKSSCIHEGHTFAISCNESTLVVYDTGENEKYENKYNESKNYRKIIDSLKGKRKIKFYKIPNSFKYKKILEMKNQGCIIYTDQLEQDRKILNPNYIGIKHLCKI